MDQQRIYAAAREILRGIEDEPLDRLTIREALFMFRQCMRTPSLGLTVVASFNEKDLQELIAIAKAVLSRRDKHEIH